MSNLTFLFKSDDEGFTFENIVNIYDLYPEKSKLFNFQLLGQSLNVELPKASMCVIQDFLPNFNSSSFFDEIQIDNPKKKQIFTFTKVNHLPNLNYLFLMVCKILLSCLLVEIIYIPKKYKRVGRNKNKYKKIIGYCCGSALVINFQWFYRSIPITPKVEFIIEKGSLFIMSENATGFNSNKSSIMTLRHSFNIS